MSAASAAGEAVLSAVVRVLAGDPCCFRFAASQEHLRELNSRDGESCSAGEFITVHPADEEQFQRLAAELDRATAGLPGPAVRSDRPYRVGSRVHYRYGAFAPPTVPGEDTECRPVPRGPGRERTEEVRGTAHRAPERARDPFDGARTGARTGRAWGRRRGGVLPVGRYAVTAVVRQSARGGVFLGQEASSGAEVVVKQARAYGGPGPAGTDARDALRHEAALLARLDGQGLAPRAVELIEREDSVFLVQERIAGQPLRGWVAARLRRDGKPDVDWAEAGPVAHGLLDLIERVHARGVVLRDLSPGSVAVRPDGTLRLVDLGLATEAGRLAGPAGAPGYRAPEHGPGRLAPARGRVADPAVDLYALGGLLFLLATGHDPLLPEGLPGARPVADRLGRWLALAARTSEASEASGTGGTGGTARRLAPAVLGLRDEEPRQRWGVARARAALREDLPGADATARPPAGTPPRHAPGRRGGAEGTAPPGNTARPSENTGGPSEGTAGPTGTTGVSGA